MKRQFNAQALFEINPAYPTVKKQCVDALRTTYIRSTGDVDTRVDVLDKHQRKILRALLIARENQLVKLQPSRRDKISPEKCNELVQRFFLHEYVHRSDFFVAGGFLLRMMENPEKDIGEIAEIHDIDIFYRDIQHVYDWIATLRDNKVTVEQMTAKEHEHNSFRVTAPSEPRPFIVQFTKTDADGIYELLESFDLPMCQIGIDLSRRCWTTLGFDALWENRADAIIYINNDAPSHLKADYDARLAKYEARGYRFKIVPERVYYGYRKFAYNEFIDEKEIVEDGKVDKFFASQAWCGGETWAERWRRHKNNPPEPSDSSESSNSDQEEFNKLFSDESLLH